PRTLGQTALAQLGRLFGTAFPTPAAYRAFRAANADPKRSLAYWDGTLRDDGPETRKARLAALLHGDPRMFRAVLVAQKDGNDHETWWDEADVVKVARERLGSRRLLRFLGRNEGWPDLADEARFARFATWALDHEAALLDDADAPALLALWEQQG